MDLLSGVASSLAQLDPEILGRLLGPCIQMLERHSYYIELICIVAE